MKYLRILAISITVLLAHASSSNAAEGHGGEGKIPEPKADAAKVPDGFKADVFLSGLTFPTSIEFDSEQNIYVAEAGYTYGDAKAAPRIIRYDKSGTQYGEITENLVGPITDLLWHDGRLFISHRGKISVLEDDAVKDLVTDLPSDGDHHNNQITAGRDGRLYFGQGVATNSGVVGADNAKMGWLKKHPDFHDIPAKDIKLTGETFTTENPLSEGESGEATTAPFRPFGNSDDKAGVVAGEAKAGGTILRVNTDGSGLEVFAWGLRNPFGLSFAPDGTLYATENGFDARGSRPIANDKEDLYKIREGAWYGWPDYGSGNPVTDASFKPEGKPQPKFLMADHPEVEKPLATFPKHSAIAKMAISGGGGFAEEGTMFIAFFGHMAPMTGSVDKHGGHRVIMMKPDSHESSDFLTQQHHSNSGGKKGGSSGKEGDSKAASAGPRRLLDVVFPPEGDALYVVDYGVMKVDKKGITPEPGTGVVWKVSKKEPGERDAEAGEAEDPKQIGEDEVKVESGEEVEKMRKDLPDRADISFKDGMTGKIFHNYLHVRMTLANGDADEAKEAASNLAESFTEERAELRESARMIAGSGEIAKQREHFQKLTNGLEELFVGNLSHGTFYKQECPMAFDGKGGTWFSDVKAINNPYRDDMKTCGSVFETYKPKAKP